MKKGLLTFITLVSLTVILLGGCATHTSPTGRDQMLLYSTAEINQMGAQSFEQMKKQEKINRDPAINNYVTCISQRITSRLPSSISSPSQQWEVVVFDSEQVNAFALPGGYIGVYSGLLKVAKNEDQLATVIGHEIAHVLANHSNEKVSRAQLTNTGLQLADVALGAGEISNREIYMAALGLGVQVGYILPYGREQESEADLMGLEFMANAGFDPKESITLWQNMAKAGGGQGPELLSTHPSHDTRIDELSQMQQKVTPLYQQSRKLFKNSCK